MSEANSPGRKQNRNLCRRAGIVPLIFDFGSILYEYELLFTKYHSGDQIEKNEMGGTYNECFGEET
jgi:hypothetical protein